MSRGLPPLPEPQRARWQPLRVGLVELFHYDQETFHFHDGRLLLRGNNGTGKSKVMALTLPFLLDGELHPARLEPDGDPGKRMEWNLLLDRYTERQGYARLELGRIGEDGEPEYLTLGCGLKAVAGRPVRNWLFTFDGRVGRDLALVDHDRTLGRDRLIEALGERGRVHDRAHAYRRAVDERLFGLGEDRYPALLSLLIQLRQPQLSKRPDVNMLSHALTEALPPLDPGVLADVAEAFRSLDAEQEEVAALEEAAEAVGAFLEHYRRYAAIAARRRAEAVRRAHNRYETERAELNRHREQLAEAQEAEQDAATKLETNRRERQALEQRERALRDSPTMRQAEGLRQARDYAGQQRAHADRLARDGDRAEDEHRRAGDALVGQRERAEVAGAELDTMLTELADAAGHAAMVGRHDDALAEAGWPEADGAGEALPGLFEREHRRRAEGVALLREHHAAVEVAAGTLRRVRERFEEARSELDRREQARTEARTALDAAMRALVDAWRGHLRALESLEIDDPDALLAELEPWCETLAADNPAEARLAAARDTRRQALHAEQTRRETEHEAVTAELDVLADERARLEAGEHAVPPRPYWRADDARVHRPGAPLWQLVDFRDAVPDAQRAGIEAALESAGLLDAWLLPDGALRDPQTWDALIVPEEGAASGAATLDAALAPSIDARDPAAAQISVPAVERALRAIGWGAPPDEDPEAGARASDAKGVADPATPERRAWIDATGRWRLGALTGAWQKPEPAYVGHAAREAARRRRLETLAGELDDARRRLERLERGRRDCETTLARIDAEWAARPSDLTLRDAHMREAERATACREQEARVRERGEDLERAEAQYREAERERDALAEDLALPADPAALPPIEAALADYHAGLRRMPDKIRFARDARERLAAIATELAEKAGRVDALREEHADAEDRARNAEVRRDTLESSLGTDVAELEHELAGIAEQLRDVERDRETLDGRRREIDQQLGELRARIDSGERMMDEITEARASAVESLRAFADEGLLRVAAPRVETPSAAASWAPDPAVRVARRIEQELETVPADDDAWTRHQRTLTEHITNLQGTLSRHGHDASAELRDDLLLVRIIFQSRLRTPDQLAADLADEITERRTLLDQRERELLENHLIDEVASHLQERITAADRQALAINEELAARPTSTGMRLRLRWRPLEDGESVAGTSAPAGFKQARERLLRQVTAAWSEADREAIGSFLQTRIQEMRDSEAAGSLQEVLERALDYRRWHRFEVERWQDGRWRRAHGPASGGERALVITLPLFAATASHYGSARESAPRLVMLDEVFAGIDDDARAKCMGLLAQFDLDVMMTSEREWGCYPDVPGLAIAQLVRREGVDAVLVSRWRWDGRRRVREDTGTPGELEAEAIDARATGGLF